jgi:hypothetical protein
MTLSKRSNTVAVPRWWYWLTIFVAWPSFGALITLAVVR